MERLLAVGVIPSAAAWLGALADLGVPAAYWQAECARWCRGEVAVTVTDRRVQGIVGREVGWQAALPVRPDAAEVRASLPRGGDTAGGWQRLAALTLEVQAQGLSLTEAEWLTVTGIALGLAFLDVSGVTALVADDAEAALVAAARTWVTAPAGTELVAERVGCGMADGKMCELTLGYPRPTVWMREMPYVFGDTARARESIGRS